MSRKLPLITLVIAACIITAGLGQQPAGAPPAVAQLFPGIGRVPNLIDKAELLTIDQVQAELKLTDAEKKNLEAIRSSSLKRIQEKMRQMLVTRKNVRSKEAAQAREMIRKEEETSLEQALTPAQRDRLKQVQLQLQNAMAFERADVQKTLELSAEQAQTIKKIADEGEQAIFKAAAVSVSLKPKDGSDSVTPDDVREYVQTPAFKETLSASRERIRVARAAMMARVEAALNDQQIGLYRKMLGAPFELPMLGASEELGVLTRRVGVAFGIGGGQRSDPNFDVKVSKPAYTDTHPRVLVDEAHHNFHTAGGRYKPFAQLAANDGYQVAPNKTTFTTDSMKACDILVIANALGSESMGDAAAGNPAFTDVECEVLRQWIERGGALLLITDHAPMGSAAECLARKFGVDMSKGSTTDEANCAEDRPASLIFTRAKKLLGEHPITKGRNESELISRVRTFTGQSLKGPPGSTPIMKLADTAVDHIDGNEVPAKGRSQGLAFAYGAGRVVVLGEAAMLSAQVAGDGTFKMGMNAGDIDNKQFALNILHWLSGLLEPREAQRKKAA